jgi:hypothetical protein
VAEGGAEACLTSVNHYVNARHAFGDLPARFVAVVSQRHPIAGIVRADSSFVTPHDLGGQRLGGSMDNALTRELLAGLAHLGVSPPSIVETSYSDAPGALGRREVDVIADFADLVPRTRRQAGVDVHAVRAGAPVYATGLVVADRVGDDEVADLRSALVAALEEHRKDPRAALGVLTQRYPGIDPDDALEGWSYAEECIFTDAPVGGMTAERWATTAEHVARVHGRPVPAEAFYREKFVTPR